MGARQPENTRSFALVAHGGAGKTISYRTKGYGFYLFRIRKKKKNVGEVTSSVLAEHVIKAAETAEQRE